MKQNVKGIVLVGRFYDGANWSYIVSGAPIIFGTKKQAREYIKTLPEECQKNFLRDLRKA